MARIQIREGDLTCAMEDNAFEHSWVLDLTTGKIDFMPTEFFDGDIEEWDEFKEQMEAEPERFRTIEPLSSRIGFNIMADFTASLPASHLQDRLYYALNGRHPFRHFKDVLCDDLTVRQAFFAYRDQQLLVYARQWLEDEGIDAELIPYDKVEE